MQNLLVVNVPQRNADALAKELDAIGLKVGGSSFYRGTVACSGTEFCKLAITETKSFSRWLVEELEERLPGFDQHLKLHVTGCPNSCGQHWIADIGIDGKKLKVDGQFVDAYYFCLGGALGFIRQPRAQWDIAVRRQRCRMPSKDCCGTTSLRGQMAKICVSSSPGIPTRNCGNFWRVLRWRRLPAIFPP